MRIEFFYTVYYRLVVAETRRSVHGGQWSAFVQFSRQRYQLPEKISLLINMRKFVLLEKLILTDWKYGLALSMSVLGSFESDHMTTD